MLPSRAVFGSGLLSCICQSSSPEGSALIWIVVFLFGLYATFAYIPLAFNHIFPVIKPHAQTVRPQPLCDHANYAQILRAVTEKTSYENSSAMLHITTLFLERYTERSTRYATFT